MNKKGFTLVELMIVVAILGILAAIAIPKYVELKAKRQRATHVVQGQRHEVSAVTDGGIVAEPPRSQKNTNGYADSYGGTLK